MNNDRLKECYCMHCDEERSLAGEWLPIRFYLCSICGNKRCPHATNHKLECTNSNEPGQKGSVYE